MNSDQELDRLLKQAAAEHQPALPSPDLIWWRAHILRKQEQKQRIEKPIVVMRWLAIMACAVAFVVLVIANAQQIQAFANRDGWFVTLGILAFVVCLTSAMVLLRSPAKNRS
jgi:hypothetical protein